MAGAQPRVALAVVVIQRLTDTTDKTHRPRSTLRQVTRNVTRFSPVVTLESGNLSGWPSPGQAGCPGGLAGEIPQSLRAGPKLPARKAKVHGEPGTRQICRSDKHEVLAMTFTRPEPQGRRFASEGTLGLPRLHPRDRCLEMGRS